jgi:hypothetical protein
MPRAKKLHILKFPAPEEPKPLKTLWEEFILGDRIIQVINETWKTTDLPRVPYPTRIDPFNPDQAASLRAMDIMTGETIPLVSSAVLGSVRSHHPVQNPRQGA